MKSIRVAGVAIAAGIALTACSQPVEAGAAAVVGQDRISSSALNQEVRAYSAALERAKINPSQLGVPLNQFVLQRMVTEARFQQLSAKYQVAISEAEVDTALKNPGQMQTPEMNLLAKGLDPADPRGFIRAELGVYKIIDQLGGANNQQAMQKIQEEFNSIRVAFNPRYGTYDGQQQTFVDTGRFGKLTSVQQQPQQPPQG
ncbi:peptidyl-prolyl cis-trans isomerase SurA [Nonomuraea soli]|uniref:Peptidyl-prolyl cis-trans isomerase SurA n=1 Tax=Nonomuraea soli TaxID=1032476 RepID=A0A7W0CQZ8_9ACTN|nr:peptidyl-prolyl cis-trans isomerase SurA [Nonomuraea soli]